jgi:hypothetical protein
MNTGGFTDCGGTPELAYYDQVILAPIQLIRPVTGVR